VRPRAGPRGRRPGGQWQRGDRGLRVPLARALRPGLTVLALRLPGLRRQPRTSERDGLALDVRAAHRYLAEQAGFAAGRQVYLGESLGAAVVTELAHGAPARCPRAALAVHRPRLRGGAALPVPARRRLVARPVPSGRAGRPHPGPGDGDLRDGRRDRPARAEPGRRGAAGGPSGASRSPAPTTTIPHSWTARAVVDAVLAAAEEIPAGG
jgi:hypothetical protein